MLKKIMNFKGTFGEVSREVQNDIHFEMNIINSRRAIYVLIIGILAELALILFYDIPNIIKNGFFEQNMLYYLILHSVIFFASFLGILSSRKVSSGKSYLSGKFLDFEKIASWIAFLILSSTALINALDQAFSSSITIYAANVLLISVLILIKPPFNIAVFLSSHLFFVIGMIMNQPVRNTMIINIVNGSIIMSCALVISTTFYFSVYENIYKTFMLREANAKLEILSNIDYLTGLYNRRFFYAYMEKQLPYMERYSEECAVIIYDLDNFKEINDTYGHAFGDQVIKSFSDVLKDNCREADLAVRWGGEEFVVVLFKAPIDEAVNTAERILELQRNNEVVIGDDRATVTVSAGVVMLNDFSVAGVDKAFVYADYALYKAKKEGKNRVAAYNIQKEERFA